MGNVRVLFRLGLVQHNSAYQDAILRIANRSFGRRRQEFGIGEPPEKRVRVEQELHGVIPNDSCKSAGH